MHRILITGVSGFVGSKLFNEYSKVNEDVIGVDTAIYSKSDNLYSLDLLDYENVADFFRGKKISTVVHCAAIAHQKIGTIDSEEYQRVNSIATEHLAMAASTANPDVHFVFLSSISVYGEDNINGTVSEESECKPSSDYANSKLDAEQRLSKLYKSGMLKKLDILRLAPVYDSEWSLNLDRRVFAPKKIFYIKFGPGEQEMSAVSRQNLVDFIDFRLKQEEDNKKELSYCNIFNICDEKPYKFNEILRVFMKSEYHPNRFVIVVPLSVVWLATRLTGLIIWDKRQWLHSCYDKLAYSLVFDNKKMLGTGFKPKHNLNTVFLVEG